MTKFNLILNIEILNLYLQKLQKIKSIKKDMAELGIDNMPEDLKSVVRKIYNDIIQNRVISKKFQDEVVNLVRQTGIIQIDNLVDAIKKEIVFLSEFGSATKKQKCYRDAKGNESNELADLILYIFKQKGKK